MSLTQFLCLLSKLLRLCYVQGSLKLALRGILRLVRYVGQLLDRMRRRQSMPRPPDPPNERPPCKSGSRILPSTNSETTTCYSQVPAPPTISILPDSPISSSVSETRSAFNVPLSRANSEYLHPNSGFAGRPYAHSEPAMSLHRISASPTDPPRYSSPSRESRRSRSPSPTRSVHRPHVNTGITTVKTPVQASTGVSARVRTPEPGENEATSTRSLSPEHSTVSTIFYTHRYERYVKMSVYFILVEGPVS